LASWQSPQTHAPAIVAAHAVIGDIFESSKGAAWCAVSRVIRP
jgi:hypothetical protein